MKTAKNFLEEANAIVARIPAEEAVKLHGDSDKIFIDVRDSGAIEKSGTIAGALRIPRGFIEFVADEATDFPNPVLKKDADIYLVCGAGGQAALAGKTLKDMGFSNVTNIGGVSDWKAAGGPSEN